MWPSNILTNVEIKLLHENYKNKTWDIPNYKTSHSAGFDLRAAIDKKLVIYPNTKSEKISLGLSIWLNDPSIMLVFVPKSGLGCNYDQILGNTIGIVDADYQGELKVCIKNNGNDSIIINPGDFVCQGIIMPILRIDFDNCKIVDEFSFDSERRNDGGINRNGK